MLVDWRTTQLSIRSKIQLLCIVLFLLCAYPPSSAQTVCGSIIGHVLDATGAVVRHAALTLRNTETAEQRTTETDGRGDYKFSCLPLGSYQLDIVSAGFRHLTRTSIDVTVGSVVSIDPVLVVGSAS